MKPLIVLSSVFIIAFTVNKLVSHSNDMALPARIALSAMLAFTAIGHFVYTKGMTMMLPDFLPFKKQIVLLTGATEIVAAIGLQIPAVRIWTAWALIIFFLTILPSNIIAAKRNVDYQKGNLQGPGINYLSFRIPLQILFIAWTYFSSIRS